MSIKKELTGKTRYRVQNRMFGNPLVVLQVEVHVHGEYLTNSGGDIEDVPVDNTFYRDAIIEDITETEADD